jgi:hypothetical protein
MTTTARALTESSDDDTLARSESVVEAERRQLDLPKPTPLDKLPRMFETIRPVPRQSSAFGRHHQELVAQTLATKVVTRSTLAPKPRTYRSMHANDRLPLREAFE